MSMVESFTDPKLYSTPATAGAPIAKALFLKEVVNNETFEF